MGKSIQSENVLSELWNYSLECLKTHISHQIDIKNLDLISELTYIADFMWFDADASLQRFVKILAVIYNPTTFLITSNKIPNGKDISCPPIWSSIFLDLIKFNGIIDQPDKLESLKKIYDIFKKNILWWENTHFNKEIGLFASCLTPKEMSMEMNMVGSKRFSHKYNGTTWENCGNAQRNLVLVDLNSQMCDYYQNMGVLGMLFEDPEMGVFFEKARNLQSQASKFFWDEESQFYYDYDLKANSKQPIKTIAGFWPLVGGLASKCSLPGITQHLLNENEFFTPLPIPTISKDETEYGTQVWNGPVSLFHNNWIIKGLKRYNLNNTAAQLSKRIFTYLNSSFELYHTLYPHYPPEAYNVSKIIPPHNLQTPVEESEQPCDGSKVILHSIFYRGLLGAEILDDAINFVPDWNVVDNEIRFSYNYQGASVDGFLSKFNQKMFSYPNHE